MKRGDLQIGEEYMLRIATPRPRGVYLGEHDGRLELADGSTYYAGGGYLRFSIAGADGGQRIVLLPSGADVEESAAAQGKREAAQLADTRQRAAARAIVASYLADLGFEISAGGIYDHRDQARTRRFGIRYDAAEPEDIFLEGVSFWKIRELVIAATKHFSLAEQLDAEIREMTTEEILERQG